MLIYYYRFSLKHIRYSIIKGGESLVTSNLRLLMAKSGIKTLRELGRRANVSWKIISNLDNNESIESIQLQNILKVCLALGCRIEDLLDIQYPRPNDTNSND